MVLLIAAAVPACAAVTAVFNLVIFIQQYFVVENVFVCVAVCFLPHRRSDGTFGAGDRRLQLSIVDYMLVAVVVPVSDYRPHTQGKASGGSPVEKPVYLRVSCVLGWLLRPTKACCVDEL